MIGEDLLKECLRASRREVESRGHTWDIADVVEVVDQWLVDMEGL